jgi:hypothetical protein
MSSVISGESFSTVSIVLSTVVVISTESLNISSVGEEHLPEIDEIKTLTKQIVSEQPKDIELEFDTPEGKSEIYRESIEVSKSSVEISDETFVVKVFLSPFQQFLVSFLLK